VPPPVLSYAATAAVYTKGTAIAPDTPTNSGGAVTSYSVAPTLPAGLSLNAATGVISGTPTAVTAQALYKVTAGNAGGNSTAGLTLTVNDIAPVALSYSANPAIYAVSAAIAPNTPSWSTSGGAPTSFSGFLPPGLLLDPVTGVISGTPAAQALQAMYTVTATNTGGSSSAMLTLTVLPQAPFISKQPASQFVGSGISTSFFVLAGGGGGTLNYQWFKNNAAVGTSDYFYTTPVLSNADNGDQVSVVVSDNYGRSVPSDTATLTIKGVSGKFVNTGTPTIARSGTATLLQNGMVLIVGGRNGNTTLATAELYDPASGSFTVTGSLATGRDGHSATLLQNGKVLIAGGYTIGGGGGGLPTIASAELYDPATGTFSSTGSLGTGRTGHSATLLSSGKVLVAGGATSNGFLFTTLGSAELYDPVAGTFSATGSLNTARSASATLLGNGQVLIAGGGNSSLTALASAEIYDPSRGTFALTGSLLTARGGNSATLLQNGKVLIAGGSDIGGNLLASAELFDPTTGTFAATGSLNLARSSAATLLSGGKVLIVGGNDVSAGAQPSLNMSELYDPVAGVFIFNAPTNAFRFFVSATLLPNGRVLIAGQETSAIMVTQPIPAELYEP
jgi:hypothetical protein